MEVINLILSTQSLHTLVMLVAVIAGFVWFEKRINENMDKKLNGLSVALRQEMGGLGAALRQEMGGLGAALRQEMDERFTAFHRLLKTNDFAHLNETIKALTFTLQKNKYLDPEDKKFVDSHLDDK